MSAPVSPTALDLDADGFLGQQRWFAGKGRAWQVTGVDDRRLAAPRARPCASTLVDRHLRRRRHRDLPAAAGRTTTSRGEHLAHAFVGEGRRRRRHAIVYDALHDKEATVLLVRTASPAATAGDGWRFHRDPTRRPSCHRAGRRSSSAPSRATPRSSSATR